jgi:hypothetical protein
VASSELYIESWLGRRPASYVARWLGSQSQARGRLPYLRPGELVGHFPAPADRDGLYGLTRRVAAFNEPVRWVVESMVRCARAQPRWSSECAMSLSSPARGRGV